MTPFLDNAATVLVMAPGGCRFGDDRRLGLPLSFIVVAVGVPLILRVWPLR